ncbi:Phosphodiesterase [Fasciola gigantica]|uniref:Phosphodiesterase n=1 Tax=Fasciola gigantica TaxID=46835 RepID=A0A504YUZ9_FASGI|nr:Phosphodiesterase [Fasciola gigantica]
MELTIADVQKKKDSNRTKISQSFSFHGSSSNRGLTDCSYTLCSINYLKACKHWNFNIFSIERLTDGHPILGLGLYIFERYKLIEKFKIDTLVLFNTFRILENSYHQDNVFHNAIHAADVVQASLCLLRDLRNRKVISNFDFACSTLAAFGHDLDHPGVNQSYLEKTDDFLAEFYQHSSVLENHHFRSTVSVLQKTKLLNSLSSEKWQEFVRRLKLLILSTDITRQQHYVEHFKTFLNTIENSGRWNDTVKQEIVLVQQMVLKCADVSNPCRNWESYVTWANLITEEFFKQGDQEKERGLHVFPTMDRLLTTKQKIQTNFIQFIVLPLIELWDSFIQSKLSGYMVKKCYRNLHVWQSRGSSRNSTPVKKTTATRRTKLEV